MTRPWFRALARKFFSGRQLQTTSRPKRRRGVRLRLEQLEDRTVTSTLQIDSPMLLAAVPEAATIHVSSDATGHGGSGLDQLLQDVQSLGSGTIDSVDRLPSNLDRLLADAAADVTLNVTDGKEKPASSSSPPDPGATPQPSAPATSLSGPGASPQPLAPPSGALPVRENRVENVVVQTSPSGGLARTDPTLARASLDPNILSSASAAAQPGPPPGLARTEAPTAQPGSDPIVVNLAVTDLRPIPQTLPDASPEVVGPLSQSTNVPGAGAPQAPLDPLGSETNGSNPTSRPAGAAELQAGRAEAQRFLADLPDGTLLQRFVTDGEQAAFTTLVQRYERFVLGICRRVLSDAHAAQDAFQATFLVLAQKASILDRHSPLAGWLYKVAYHMALRLRAVATRRRRREKDAAAGGASEGPCESPAEIEKQELRQALAEELRRLPEKYRAPLVLVYFDGLTHEEAARAIGVPRGSMAKRIGEGLAHLRERLCKRGFLT
jgi:RNA polymerase sigma factor (sigma-70 family)